MIHYCIHAFVSKKDDAEDITSLEESGEDDKTFNTSVIIRTEDELKCQNDFSYDTATLARCYDDKACKVYGDCCKNSTYYEEREQTFMRPRVNASIYNNSLYGCFRVEGMNFESLIIAKCPRTFADAEATAVDREIRNKCEHDASDTISRYPVTSAVTGHVYKNTYCAWCHGDRNRVVYWKPVFRCLSSNGISKGPFQLEDGSDRTLLYHEGQWYYTDYDAQKLLHCVFELQQPKIEAAPALRKCVGSHAGLVDGCPAGTPAPLARACASYTYYLFEYNADNDANVRAFRNVECARCNNVTTKHLKCSPPPPKLRTVGFNVLFKAAYKRSGPCSQNELYDVIATRCRDVHEELQGACRKSVEFKAGEYDSWTVDNASVYVYKYKKRIRYQKMGSGGTVDVCIEDADGLLHPNTRSVYATYLVYAGIAGSFVSVAALVAHLALFGSSGTEPKNLPEKNLASLSVSLLLGYCGFLSIALKATPAGSGWPCLTSALATQFGFLAAFSWMFIMSVDVWSVLNASTKKLRVVGGQRNGRFIAYSTFAWLVPASLTAFSAVLQLSKNPVVPEFRPNFQYNCWFRNPQSLIALFVLPAGVTIAANYVSFVGAVRLISSSGVDGFKSAGSSSTAAINRARKNFKIYVRLSLMMGLAWIFGLAGALTDSDVVWTAYTVLNSLQGAFIFLAFDCNWKTAKTLVAFRKVASVSDTQTTNITPLSATN
ncbi:GPCR, family 2-like,GPCR, family 2, secretin-like [Cinara cedri]|uniref:GPCR, family 2-like,GPCR, family 2, secretin-like n=1 Tax=Cinara cedri TaxID=506608 RepID=A0A5E4MF01_9HEMI|nr:GPCR, family 2-like,GPCR, family 2, secretin-like [Cinara cedri]